MKHSTIVNCNIMNAFKYVSIFDVVGEVRVKTEGIRGGGMEGDCGYKSEWDSMLII